MISNTPTYHHQETESWADLLARYIETEYSRRFDRRAFQEAKRNSGLLLPESLEEDINWIKRMAFPSILELLQRGVGTNPSQQSPTVFTNGLHSDHLKVRFESLSYQHRMEEPIARTSAKFFYKGDNLKTSTYVTDRRPPLAYRQEEGPVVWVHNALRRQRPSSKSSKGKKQRIINQQEVDDLLAELESIHQAAQSGQLKGQHEVAVLSFYKDQVHELRTRLRKLCKQPRSRRNFSYGPLKIQLCTVDKFQGQEADIVLLSFVKTSRGAFYHSPNRLNVALTRARYKLVLFGNCKWMAKSSPMEALKSLGSDFETRTTNRRSST